MTTSSDKVLALEVAYDILSGYAASYDDPEEDFSVKVVKLADIFIAWSEGEDITNELPNS